MNPKLKYTESKHKQPFFEINNDMYMIFQDKSSLNFNSCNSFIIKTDNKITIIDPGCSRLNLIKTFKKLDIEIKSIKNIILTHSHSDHYVLVKYLRKKTNLEVYIHSYDQEFLKNKSKYIDFLFDLTFFKNRPKFHDFYQVLLFFSNADDQADDIQTHLNPIIKNIFNTWNIYNIYPDHIYSDNDILPGNLKVIHLPGHTPGHCGLISLNHPLIFSADIDFNKRGPVVSSKYANISDFKNSLNKLIRLIQQYKIQYLYPSHWNPIFSDLEVKIKDFYNKVEIKQNQIIDILKSKEKMTIDEITQETFKKFTSYFSAFITDSTKDSLIVAEASDLLTNRNYLIELKRLNKVKRLLINQHEYWKIY
ncbi:MAG: MBL fold metallo-hydrolase [Candidatus Helarchaeota archaeon]